MEGTLSKYAISSVNPQNRHNQLQALYVLLASFLALVIIHVAQAQTAIRSTAQRGALYQAISDILASEMDRLFPGIYSGHVSNSEAHRRDRRCCSIPVCREFCLAG
jgi:hypothetical protein